MQRDMTGTECARRHPTRVRGVIAASVLVAALLCVASPAPAASDPASADALAGRGWAWPLPVARLERPFLAPAHTYGPGHRGIDLAAEIGAPVRAPAAGTIAFAGAVAGRGILTIDHGGDLVTTLEPVESTLSPGMPIMQGQEVAAVALGGHAAPSSLHFGVRLHGEYINPLLLLGGIPRAVLLPCC
jgi:murein DD-endopeptidase MepM/ murein hydrolase activator NlpD